MTLTNVSARTAVSVMRATCVNLANIRRFVARL